MKPLRRQAKGSRCDLLPAEHKRIVSIANTEVIDQSDQSFDKEFRMGAFQGLDLHGSPDA